MFKRRYIFETNQTKFERYFKNSFFFFTSCFVIYSLFCLYFIYVSKEENQFTKNHLYNRSPDLIAVFTGDSGRISYAFKKAKKYNQTKLFITGVYSQNTVDTLFRYIHESLHIDKNFLEIDYQARNTVENVLSTLQYMRKNQGLHKILIISHDYHILRIKLLFNHLKNSDEDYEFLYSGIQTDYTEFRNIKILYKEVFKLFRTYAFVLLWGP